MIYFFNIQKQANLNFILWNAYLGGKNKTKRTKELLPYKLRQGSHRVRGSDDC